MIECGRFFWMNDEQMKRSNFEHLSKFAESVQECRKHFENKDKHVNSKVLTQQILKFEFKIGRKIGILLCEKCEKLVIITTVTFTVSIFVNHIIRLRNKRPISAQF